MLELRIGKLVAYPTEGDEPDLAALTPADLTGNVWNAVHRRVHILDVQVGVSCQADQHREIIRYILGNILAAP